MKPWFILLLVLQVILLAIRWRVGDAHGALLMFAVCAVGLLALSAGGGSSVDAVYGGYFGLMAMVSGLLDLNLAVESLVRSEFRWQHHRSMAKEDLSGLVRPAVYLVSALVQLLSALVAYLLYKDAEGFEDVGEETFFATQEQARIYNAVLNHSTDHRQPMQGPVTGVDPTKAFAGPSQKLPP